MHFSAITILSLTALSAAAPVVKRQASVLGSTTYNDISISGGTAGNAEAEALAIFASLDTANPENISKEDQKALNEVNQVANDAETEAFNPAIEAASGEEADALQRGKIKNKVLKLEATVLKLKAQQAQGTDVTEKLATEQKKLDNNIALDAAEAGKTSTALSFDATIGGASSSKTKNSVVLRADAAAEAESATADAAANDSDDESDDEADDASDDEADDESDDEADDASDDEADDESDDEADD